MSSFAARLVESMEARGLSQNALADELTAQMRKSGDLPKGKKVYASVINRWTKALAEGGSIPEGKYMVHLPAVLERNGHWLLTGQGPKRILNQLEEGSEYEVGVRDAVATMRQTLDGMVRRLAPPAPKGGAAVSHLRVDRKKKSGS